MSHKPILRILAMNPTYVPMQMPYVRCPVQIQHSQHSASIGNSALVH